MLTVPQRGISRHVVRVRGRRGRVYALKEIIERPARYEYAVLGDSSRRVCSLAMLAGLEILLVPIAGYRYLLVQGVGGIGSVLVAVGLVTTGAALWRLPGTAPPSAQW
ncbi:hypothetical protein [Saccharothrix sp. HUAS TT1]|uniref:hypothetical protein n=1 Tax=unclassified Saccharothrix TaxID=2593673 RepID=UPI00345BD9FB